jgi:hypothetical protein
VRGRCDGIMRGNIVYWGSRMNDIVSLIVGTVKLAMVMGKCECVVWGLELTGVGTKLRLL